MNKDESVHVCSEQTHAIEQRKPVESVFQMEQRKPIDMAFLKGFSKSSDPYGTGNKI